MASACCSPIAGGYPYGSTFEQGIESSKPSASSNAQPCSVATCSEPSGMDELASTNDLQFRPAHPMNQFPRPGRKANLSHESISFLGKSLPHPKQVIDLTLDDDDGDDDDIEVNCLLNVGTTPFHLGLTPVSLIDRFSTVLPSSLQGSPAHYEGYTWQETTSLEECPSVVKIIRQA
jgi:hypothetical protein